MRIRLFFSVGLLILFLASMALMQDSSPPAMSVPTATWSPRAIEGLYQTLRINYGLEIENSSESFPSHAEVSTFIQAFAQDYLGSDPYMPYAAQIYTGFMGYDQYHRMAASLSEPLAQSLNNYLYSVKRLPMASIGVRKDGFAIVYTPRCHNQWCSTPQEYLKFLHHTGALAVYVSFVDHRVLDENEATTLIGETFPSMQSLIESGFLRASEVEVRETFTVQLESGGQKYGKIFPVNYMFGVVNLPRAALVYAIVGVGDGYAELIKP